MILETILIAGLSPAFITSEHCTMRRESAEFMARMSYFMDKEEMRRLFPRHSNIVYEIYKTDKPELVVPALIHKQCMRDAVI